MNGLAKSTTPLSSYRPHLRPTSGIKVYEAEPDEPNGEGLGADAELVGKPAKSSVVERIDGPGDEGRSEVSLGHQQFPGERVGFDLLKPVSFGRPPIPLM